MSAETSHRPFVQHNGQHKQTKQLEQSMATSQPQKLLREPLLTLVTTRAFVSPAQLFTQLPFMPCCRKAQQNIEKDTITVYSTAAMAMNRAIYSSNPNRKYKTQMGLMCPCV